VGASDDALLAAMAAGDTDAAAAFVRRFQARVYGLALTVVGVPGTAEDVAQEALVRVWRHADAYDPRRGEVASWLLTITRNLAIDVLRVRREEPSAPDALVNMLTTVGAEETENVADADRIRCSLRALPHDQAVAVIMAVYYGFTAREIAERLSIPLGTAKTRIRLGMARLREQLGATDE
jgi:RNA polymerase sigma factor (sigma-70 family)